MFGQSSIIPASGAVRFQTRRCNGQASASVPAFYTHVAPLSSLGITQISGPGFVGATKWFHDRVIAQFNAGGTTPTNQSILDTLAEQIIKDYFIWKSQSFDEVYPEVIAPTPNALLDTIEWTYRPKKLFTRLFTSDYNSEPEELFHWDSTIGGCNTASASKTPCFESYGPPTKQGGLAVVEVFLNCLTDGKLFQTYIRKDTLPCDCGTSSCSGQVCATVRGCGILVDGTSIDLINDLGVAVNSCVTSSGICCMSFKPAGTYTLVAHGDCGLASASFFGICGQTANASLNVPSINVTVNYSILGGTCVTLGGCHVHVTGNGMNLSASLPDSGVLSFCVPKFGTYALEFTCSPCFNSQTDTVTVSSCSTTKNITVTAVQYTWTGEVDGCDGGPLGGIGWTISGDVGTFSGTTTADGIIGPLNFRSGCNGTLTLSKPPRWLNTSWPIGIGCENSVPDHSTGSNIYGLNVNGNWPSLPPTGYLCFCCDEPITYPPTLTDSSGTYSMVPNGSIGFGTNCLTTALPITVSCVDPSPLGGLGCGGGTYSSTVAYTYFLQCTHDGQWTLTRYITVCNDGSGGTAPVGSYCNFSGAVTPSGNPASCATPGLNPPLITLAETVTATVDCVNLRATFNFTYGFSDTVVVQG